jgi:hypothetical protein
LSTDVKVLWQGGETMNLSSVQSGVQVSMIRKDLDQQSASAQKLFDGLDQASSAINAMSKEPGKGQVIDVRV